MKSTIFKMGFGIPRDRLPVAHPKRIADWNRTCNRTGCGAKHKAHESWIRSVQDGKKGWECISHVDDYLRRYREAVIDNGLVFGPKDSHGHRTLYLVFKGGSMVLKRITLPEAGFVLAAGAALSTIASRISFQEEGE